MRKRIVIVAAKAPCAGSVKTRLCPPLLADDAARLAGAFLVDTWASATAGFLDADAALALEGDPGDLPVEIRGAGRILGQSGNSLGARLVHMMEAPFAEGYGAVCVIGSDAPHLPAAFLLEAFGRLERGADAVLGPSDDGGYYLIGLPRPAPMLFDNIPWSTGAVREATLARAAEAGLSASLLPPWYDVDTAHDLRRLRGDLRRGVARAPATAEMLKGLTF